MAIHTCRVTYIYLVTYICPTKFSDVGFCPTKFKLCPTKIKSDRTNVLSSQIFICSPGVDYNGRQSAICGTKTLNGQLIFFCTDMLTDQIELHSFQLN
jgi:hypothetical protein